MDDKDFWEEEYTDLDRFQKRKNVKRAELVATPGFGMSGQRSTNDFIIRSLEENPQGWMVTDIKRNATHFNSMDGIITLPSIESEVTIKVWDEDLLSKLVEAMRHMSSYEGA